MNITMKTQGGESYGLTSLLWIFAKVFTQADFIHWYGNKKYTEPYRYKTVMIEVIFIKTKV